jgi:aerobic carbon-monoxide dehydrogenase small subunit
MRLSFEVNGVRRELDVDPAARLIDVLRIELGLTGTKEGCGEGECGACTVLLDDRAVDSCLVIAAQVRDRRVLTVEGLARDGELDVLQQQFIDHGAVQCGFCAPGMLMSAKALLLAHPQPTERQIRVALAGNLCRCTGYGAIITAVTAASRAIAEGGGAWGPEGAGEPAADGEAPRALSEPGVPPVFGGLMTADTPEAGEDSP